MGLTAQNFPIGSVPHQDQEAFALEIKPDGGLPFYLSPGFFISNKRSRQTKVEVHSDNSVSIDIHTIRNGSQTADIRNAYRFKSETDRSKELIETLSQDYPDVELTDFEIINIDSITPSLIYHYQFNAPNYLTEAGEMLILRIPWADKLSPSKALSYESRAYPFTYWPNADTIREEIEIRIPAGYQPMEFTPRYDYHCSIANYNLDLSFEEGVLRGTRQLVNKKSVVPPESYLDFKEFYNKVVKADRNQILIKQL